jgi:hypothetical protein
MIAVIMQRLMIQAEPDLIERAKRRAAERGVSMAQFLREAMERELASSEEHVPPPLTCVGAFDSGRSDLSELASDHVFPPRSWR